LQLIICVSPNIFEVIEDRKHLSDLTDQLIDEVNRRGKLLKASGFENLGEYNRNAEINNLPKMHRIFLVIDELVESLSGKKKDEKYIEYISENLESLARLRRALGVHIIAGTQLPTVKDIGSSQFKNNIPGRLCGKFADKSASRVVLSSNIVTKLSDIQDRMIFKKGANYLEIQTPLCNSQMVKVYINKYGNQFKLVDDLKRHKNRENIKTLSEMKEERKREFEKSKDENDKLSKNNG
jgi:S-DNA-T family DNA segregation ATPase FtsK/SpoIIIE